MEGRGERGRRERKERAAEGVEEKLTIVILANGDEDPIWFRGLDFASGAKDAWVGTGACGC